MDRRKSAAKIEFVLCNVLYEDGSMSSNRRVQGSVLATLEATIQPWPASRLRIGRLRNDRDVPGRGSNLSPERMAHK